MPTSSSRWLAISAVAVLGLVASACGSKGGGKPPPEQPYTGAPVAVVADKINADSVDVRVYNFSDRSIARYVFLIQYKDKDGKVLRTKAGTSFENDFEFMSMSGRKFIAEPKSWATMTIDMLEPPAGAASAEVLASSLGAVGKDGMSIEDFWELEGGTFEWPARK